MDPGKLYDSTIQYESPPAPLVRVQKDMAYKTVGQTQLRLDVYSPAEAVTGSLTPAIIFIHGDGPAERLRDAKEWGQYTGWGRLAAGLGFVGVTFNHRSTEDFTCLSAVASDIDDLIGYVRGNAESLGIDRERLCLWTCSAGGPVALWAALGKPVEYIRCIVSYYAIMDLQPIREHIPPEVSDQTLREFSPVHHLGVDTHSLAPMFIARAGLDHPLLNESIDRFVQVALARNVALDVMNHPTGQHGFDTLDDNPRTREIIMRTLEFIQAHLTPA